MSALTQAVVWHDVEHGGYDADLPLWRELAAEADGPVLDLGAGTGRVATDLAARGHEVVALDIDPALLAALTERDARVTTVTGDARTFDLDATFGLVLAPMQLVQILGGRDGRLCMLRSARAHLNAGGLVAVALVEAGEALPHASDSPPVPDMLERDGWLFSSRPVAVDARNGCVIVTRRREVVTPAGERHEESVEVALNLVTVGELEDEARAAGLEVAGRRQIAETADHIASTVVLCAAGSGR